MKVIGITGTTGSGKTTVLKVLNSLGYETIDCDALYYELLQTYEPLRMMLREAFGSIFLPNGELDRKALADKVFSSENELKKLNNIVFNTVSQVVITRIKQCVSPKGIAIDAINLIDSGISDYCSTIIAVTSNRQHRIQRIMQRDNLSEDEALQRITAQKSDIWYSCHCNYLIENDFDNSTDFQKFVEDFLTKSLSL